MNFILHDMRNTKSTKIEESKNIENFTLLPWFCANIGYVIGIAYDMFKSVAVGAFFFIVE